MLIVTTTASACQQAPASRDGNARHNAGHLARTDSSAGDAALAAAPAGIDPRGIPYYSRRAFSRRERQSLLAAFGVDQPQWLYLSDSSGAAMLKFDTRRKRCRSCFVDSYRVGFASLRRPGETWDDFESRVRRMSPHDFPESARRVDTSLTDLDPDARPSFVKLLDSARRAGFRLAIHETYRTPAREALLFQVGRGRTYTATSMHSYGRAVDILVDDGNPGHATTRADWVRFRRFVAGYDGGEFRLIGSVDHTWDWPHVELPGGGLGFRSVDQALAFAAWCTTDSARAAPPPAALLRGAAADPCVFVPHLAPSRP